ncbi:patatin-like phospholipase family protein [Desulfonatronum thioautotrophicum]|uniref:patatin-like phospholipase family protein n=1 Tax=Desulfonatronum thioautotrophicum TaxID=617001 RepID=UPI0005EB6BE7|nr:patatin-like phospholipase family protein [Desulfonatronum thioautotrophicum]
MRKINTFSRRTFLIASGALTATVPLASLTTLAKAQNSDIPTLGLALGSGGASGLAHIPMLEVLDELDIVPKVIAGSSIGAIIGALYASGLSGADLRRLASDFAPEDKHFMRNLIQGSAGLSLMDLIRLDLDDGGLLDSDGFLDFLETKLDGSTFEDLPIPLKLVAADFWKREQVILDKGPLIPAIKASMAVPGLFAPVPLDGHLLVDGGTVNPLPFDLIDADCDLTVAVDVSGGKAGQEEEKPDVLDALFNTFEIMQQAITREKMKHITPGILVQPETSGIRLLHFYKAGEIFSQSASAAEELKSALREHLRNNSGNNRSS